MGEVKIGGCKMGVVKLGDGKNACFKNRFCQNCGSKMDGCINEWWSRWVVVKIGKEW